MEALLHCPFELSMELAAEREPGSVPLARESVQADLAPLVEETFVRGVLAGSLPPESDSLRARVRPLWRERPVVAELEVALLARRGGSTCGYAQRYSSGPWARRSLGAARRLREEGALGPEGLAWIRIVAERGRRGAGTRVPALQAPEILDSTLEAAGVRGLGQGGIEPDRPVLVCARAVDEILAETVRAGARETGGAMLGRTIRLPEPLPGASTPIVTLLTAAVPDARHVGEPGRFTFSPEALASAAAFAAMRGLGECVPTAYHSHGWGTGCDECNAKATCALPACDSVSPDDYVLLETLFPSKSTLMPIAGRKHGAPGRSPVMEVHAWRGGRMQPIAWRRYED